MTRASKRAKALVNRLIKVSHWEVAFSAITMLAMVMLAVSFSQRQGQNLVVLFALFAFTILISQTAMDVFASLFVLVFLFATFGKKELLRSLWDAPGKWIAIAWFAIVLIGQLVRAFSETPIHWYKLADFRWIILASMLAVFFRLLPLSKRAFDLAAFGFGVCCFYSILVFVFGHDLVRPSAPMQVLADGTIRSGGFHMQPIVNAHLFGLWFCFFLGRLTALNFSLRDNGWQIAALILGAGALLVSFTRGVWLAAVVAFIVVLFLCRSRRFILVTLGTATMIGGLLLTSSAIRNRVLETGIGTDSQRTFIWRANWKMALDHPIIGVGYASNVDLLPKYYDKIGAPPDLPISHAHNQFLHMLAGTGSLGLIMYLAFWSFMIFFAFFLYAKHSKLKEKGDPQNHAANTLGVLMAFVFFQIGGLTEANLEHVKIRYALAILLAILWATPAILANPNEASQSARV